MTAFAARIFAAALAVLCAGACYQESAAAWSNHLAGAKTLASLERASAWTPLDTALLRERGILSLDTNPEQAERLLRQAVALNGFEVEAFVGLGLLAESRGEFEAAEKHLTRAASLSRRFKPKFALAFFYARRGELDRFWPAASAAANIEGADALPVFRLAHRILNDPEQTADMLHLSSQHALENYAGFLLKKEGRTALSRVALRIEPNPDSRPLLIAAVDRLINDGQVDAAVPLWNRLNGNRSVPLAPSRGVSLTNGRFAAGDGHGFEWRPAANPGIDLRAGGPGDLRIEFSGHQAESASLLEQFVPVVSGRAYRLSFTYGTSGLSAPTGLYWQVSQGNVPLATSTPLEPVSDGATSVDFKTSPAAGLVRIAFVYARPSGEMRIEGVVTLRSAELKLL